MMLKEHRHRFCCLVLLLVAVSHATAVRAEVHRLRTRGKTLIEAEAFSASSKEYPYTEPCKRCSGGQNLGYFWKDSWFEIQVQVPRDGDYTLSMRASSEQGTSIEVLAAGTNGQNSGRLGLVEVPTTRQWTRYTITEAIELSFSAGVHTLRFQNLVDGANVDYLTFSTAPADQIATFRPPKNAGPDKNPLKGFGSGWWRQDDDYATVGFQYIEWGQFEPQDDRFDWDYVEEVLSREGTRGRHLILQFVVDWDYRDPVEENYVGPDWLLKRVGEHRGHATPGDTTSRAMRATKYNDPAYVQEAIEAIAALTGYFKEDPRVFILQAGLLGFWSEWHTFPREDWSPSEETRRAVLQAYLRNLPEGCFTQIRYPDEAAVQPLRGIGYTNGSATPTEHGYEFGKLIEHQALWRNGPITGEWPPNVESDYWKRFFLTVEGERFIRQARYSTLLLPEAKDIKQQIPSWTPDDRFISMHRQLGYNLQVDRIRHVVTEGGVPQFELTLQNSGIAPFYCNWQVQLAILDAEGAVIDLVAIDTDLRQLSPAKTVVLKSSATKRIDGNRKYQIGLRILQPGADRPKLQRWKLEPRNVYVVLANEVEVIEGTWGKDHALSGGWNMLGDVVAKPKSLPFDSKSFPFVGSVRPVNQDR